MVVLHVTWYGTFVTTPKLSKESGIVNIETEIKNSGYVTKNYTLKTDIVDPAGKVIATIKSKRIIPADSTVILEQTTEAIKQPKLWSPKSPFMYKTVSTVLDGKKVLDTYETPFGFRWMEWTADRGFFLNGEHYYFKGANAHQDHGWDDIDPTVFIDDDGQAYLFWGNGSCKSVKLKKNMIEMDGPITSFNPKNYIEGPWVYKRKGLYYLVYASAGTKPEMIEYCTAKSPQGPCGRLSSL